ncbi:energy transducer TonB [Thalassotalea sp. PLHSN55]|uniref:energy transducer TonB n=1 Tax=Thalassotalea sp. PLHSN55 TaxID=3435888 RepID=UPI003F835CFD
MKTRISIITLAALITLALFSLMAFLVKFDQVAPIEVKPDVVVDVIGRQEESQHTEIVRTLKLPPKLEPPQRAIPESIEPTDNTVAYQYKPASLTLDNSTGLSNMLKNHNQEARPIVRINPRYPADAARNGIEGWVILAFDINALGEVVNINIVDAKPKRIFDKAARRALSQWKYQAKSVAGKMVAQQNLSVQLDFTIDQSI